MEVKKEIKKGTVYLGLISLVITFLTQYKEAFPPKYYPYIMGGIWILVIVKRIFWPSSVVDPIALNPEAIPEEETLKVEDVKISP